MAANWPPGLPIVGGGVPQPPFADLTLINGVQHAADDATKQVIYNLARRVLSVEPFQARLRQWCDRADLLYYPDDITQGGADLWASDETARVKGLVHISVNTPPVYIDVPSALQAEEPIENMLATGTEHDQRLAAAAQERLYTAWKQAEDFNLKFHKAITVKSLYGITAAKLYWDPDEEDGKGRVCVTMVEQPRNLYIGYQNDNYDEVEWAAYVTLWEPNALTEEYGVEVVPVKQADGSWLPTLRTPDPTVMGPRPWLAMGDARIQVWDYWYRQPVWKGTTFVRMDTYNVIIAGNLIIRGPQVYKEYAGELPYLPLYNTFIPGVPMGRSDLYDIEHLIHEKQERMTAGAQMIQNGIAGDFWQLVGPEAPLRVPKGMKPERNAVIAPGPNARIEAIAPFIAQFQLEQYLGRLDREMAAVSGLNDLLLGLAPAQVLSSSKAINALIANYESRLSMRRRLLYKWRRDIWDKAIKMWAQKDKTVKAVVGKGLGFLDIIDPSLSPRDEQETAMRAANLVNAKLWSQARGMDAVGVDDPETEQQVIREESTDATLWPERVQIMAQLLQVLQSLGLQAPQGAQAQAQGQLTSGQADLRKALGAGTPQVGPGGPGPGGAPEDMGQTPALPGVPQAAGGPPPPFAQPPASAAASPGAPPAMMQEMLKGGKTSGRIMTQQQIGRR